MKKILISSITAIALLSSSIQASDSTKTVSAKAITHAKADADKIKNSEKIVQEAVDAVKLTQDVVTAINSGKKDEAIKTIEKAIGKLEVVMSAPNAPILIPLNASVVVSAFKGSAYDVENAVITSIALLQNKRVQDARMIVEKLKDEIDVVTINLPLATYPGALKRAASFLHQNKLKEAKEVLMTALNTLVEVDLITPIGIIQAQDLIIAAKSVAKTDKKLALAHLEGAKEALKKAEALGYTSRSDTTYKMLNEQINKIEKEIKGKNEAEKLFDKLIDMIKEFKDKASKTINR